MQEQNYYTQRLEKLGITDEDNQVMLLRYDAEEQKNILKPEPVFRKHDKGIEILVYTIDRECITIEKDGSRWKKNWSIVRLEKPITKENGDSIKYLMPKGKGSFPFFPPQLVDKYDARTPIKTLFITEGFFKAFKGAMHGLDIVGLPSITHLKNKEKNELHDDIKKLIHMCSVQRVVWLTDGDCFDLSSKVQDVKAEVDLYSRPRNFYNSIATFKDLLDDYEGDKWFMHIDCDAIKEEYKEISRSEIKGLDDVLCSFPDKVTEIVDDIQNVSKPGFWFKKFNITLGPSKVLKEFRFSNITEFFLWHVERGEISKDREFIFNGTRYRYDEEKSECKIMVPGDAKDYFRVGTQYFKFVNIPNKYKQIERQFHAWDKGTIKDDHGPNFQKHIPKYQAFCNVPDHVNFQQAINGCFNVYNPLDFYPQEEPATQEDCPSIIAFMHHIFGSNTIHFTHPETKQKQEISMMDMALDYVQLLYQQPAEKLPILCLVSKENNTGKSTFGKFLKQLLGGNCAVVGNQDLAGDFNKHWSTKAVVICDETKIDKQTVIEKVKSLSTADKIMMNSKGKDHVEIDCFIKFIFITNNEESFMFMHEEDIRYWVIKVPTIKRENPGLLDNMIEEIPAFLSFLNQRKLITDRLNRMWFHPSLLKTDALKKVIAYSQPQVQKEIVANIREMFYDFGVDQILLTRKDIHQNFFKNKYEASYIERILKDNLKIDQYHKLDFTQKDMFDNPKKIYVSTRYSYPAWMSKAEGKDVERVEINGHGRPYIFLRSQFINPEEEIPKTPEQEMLNSTISSVDGAYKDPHYIAPISSSEIPFN
ncbi:DUF5906 domain-containing protein [Limnovirga soli]|uniref:NrS-1 polymerase-like helicase domain-containing protein n=1 Tax=Limnovirga soli TaxID=2656915 RepID=A0A8J8FGD7_9BACT|nr:DUF5906 domain-containing protein [Limnovirga soli]NNV55889.1 hypothetical protein [Limnovirga soli]